MHSALGMCIRYIAHNSALGMRIIYHVVPSALGMTKYFRNYERWLDLIAKHSSTTGKKITSNNAKHKFDLKQKTVNLFQGKSNAIHTKQYENCNFWLFFKIIADNFV